MNNRGSRLAKTSAKERLHALLRKKTRKIPSGKISSSRNPDNSNLISSDEENYYSNDELNSSTTSALSGLERVNVSLNIAENKIEFPLNLPIHVSVGDLRGVPARAFVEIAAELRQAQNNLNKSCSAKGYIMNAEQFRGVFAETLKTVPEFNGKITDIDKFIKSAVGARATLRLEDAPNGAEEIAREAQFLRTIIAKLDGNTFTSINNADPRTFAEFKKSFYENFKLIRNPSQVYGQITTVAQGTDETLASYFKRLETLRELYKIACEYQRPIADEQVFKVDNIDRVLLSSAIQGLGRNMKFLCRSKTHNSFRELKEFCLTEEVIENCDLDKVTESFSNLASETPEGAMEPNEASAQYLRKVGFEQTQNQFQQGNWADNPRQWDYRNLPWDYRRNDSYRANTWNDSRGNFPRNNWRPEHNSPQLMFRGNGTPRRMENNPEFTVRNSYSNDYPQYGNNTRRNVATPMATDRMEWEPRGAERRLPPEDFDKRRNNAYLSKN